MFRLALGLQLVSFVVLCVLLTVEGFMFKRADPAGYQGLGSYPAASQLQDSMYSDVLKRVYGAADESYGNEEDQALSSDVDDLAANEDDLIFSKRTYDDNASTVVFRCTPKTAKCLHGGRGPRVTVSGKKAICVCTCPKKLRGPQCTRPRR